MMNERMKMRQAIDFVQASMDSGDKYYHNFEHVMDVLRGVNFEEASLELKLAALFHDIVYDDQPRKELRSAAVAMDWLQTNWPTVDSHRVYNLIMATEGHSLVIYLNDQEAIDLIKSDLYSLTDPLATIENFVRLNREAQMLYRIDKFDAAAGARTFMLEFKKTMQHNYDLTLDEYWLKVVQGCDTTIALANDVIRRKE